MMPLWLQHLLVLLLVAACAAFVLRGLVKTLTLRKGKIGACCAKGCDAGSDTTAGGGAKPQAAGGRVVFFPSEMLTASSRKRS